MSEIFLMQPKTPWGFHQKNIYDNLLTQTSKHRYIKKLKKKLLLVR
jgi:hypothetical protein